MLSNENINYIFRSDAFIVFGKWGQIDFLENHQSASHFGEKIQINSFIAGHEFGFRLSVEFLQFWAFSPANRALWWQIRIMCEINSHLINHSRAYLFKKRPGMQLNCSKFSHSTYLFPCHLSFPSNSRKSHSIA